MQEDKRSFIERYGVNLTEKDSILTLSTCTSSGDKRIVLHAKKIDL